MTPQEKYKLKLLAFAAQLQNSANEWLAYAISQQGDVTAQDGSNPPPSNPPPPPPVND